MSVLRVALLVSLAFVLHGCALLNNLKSGNVGGVAGDLQREGKLVADASKYSDAECAPIKDDEPSWEEERAVGSAVAVGLAVSAGHFFIEGVTEKDPVVLNADLKKAKLPDNEKNELTAYLSVVGRNLARYSSRPELPWTFAVIENETPNAFSAPGGYVTVTTGLLKKINNEAQLAGVLAHEIGHITHKHALKSYKKAKYDQCKAALTGKYIAERSSVVPAAARDAMRFAKRFEKGRKVDLDAPDDDGFVGAVIKFLLNLIAKFGNEQGDEFQADATALELVAFAGYDPTEYEKFLTSLGAQGGGLFTNHPSTADRVAKIKAQREGDLAPFATGTAKPDVAKAFAPIKK